MEEVAVSTGLVDWEYGIEAEDPHAVRDNGFVPGRSTADSRRPDARHDVHRAGLFDLSAPRDLVRLLHAVLLDASSEVTLFAVAPGPPRVKDLVASLSGSSRPGLPPVLRDAEVFVDLTIGIDVDYYDAVSVASPAELQPRLDALTIDSARRIEAFAGCADNLTDVGAFLSAIPELSGIDLDAERTWDGLSAAPTRTNAKTPSSADALTAGSLGTKCKVPPAGFEPAHTAPEDGRFPQVSAGQWPT